MKIRHFPALVSLVAFTLGTVGLPAQAQSQEKTLRIAASANIKILDPGFTSAYITRNFGYMVYDTLVFARLPPAQPKPQMVDKLRGVSKDGKELEASRCVPGLKFSATVQCSHAGRCGGLHPALGFRATTHRPRNGRRRWRVDRAAVQTASRSQLKEPFGRGAGRRWPSLRAFRWW
jgi:peptide/nickel transport system substrate-binding protein